MASVCLQAQDTTTYSTLEDILSQKNMGTNGIDQISLMMPNRMNNLSDADKKIIASIDANPLANDKIRNRDQQTLSGKIQFIIDPGHI